MSTNRQWERIEDWPPDFQIIFWDILGDYAQVDPDKSPDSLPLVFEPLHRHKDEMCSDMRTFSPYDWDLIIGYRKNIEEAPPIIVDEVGGLILDGRHRWWAALMQSLPTIKAVYVYRTIKYFNAMEIE